MDKQQALALIGKPTDDIYRTVTVYGKRSSTYCHMYRDGYACYEFDDMKIYEGDDIDDLPFDDDHIIKIFDANGVMLYSRDGEL